MCSRPLDLYLKDIRIGAFVDFSMLNTHDDFSNNFAQFRTTVENALAETSLPKTRILIAREVEYPYEEMKLQNKAIAGPQVAPAETNARSNLAAAARKYALEDQKCRAFLSSISSDPQVNTNRPLETVDVHEATRTVRFIHNRIPCDGPMHTITIILNPDGSLSRAETNTMFGAEINPEPVAHRPLTIDGILIRDKRAHTKMSFYTGNYHIQTGTGLIDVTDSETVPMEALEKLVGKKVQALVRFTKGGKWDGEGQGPVLEPGEEHVFPDFYTILKIKELNQ
jgi:hypothetical protein